MGKIKKILGMSYEALAGEALFHAALYIPNIVDTWLICLHLCSPVLPVSTALYLPAALSTRFPIGHFTLPPKTLSWLGQLYIVMGTV